MPGMLREAPYTLTHTHTHTHTHTRTGPAQADRQRPSPLLMILFGREKASMNQVFISAQEAGGG